jgi:glycosyltransferase involved in cell wall biosynthesis
MKGQRRRILHLNTFDTADIGGMETHASFFRREMTRRRDWSVEPIDGGPAGPAHRSETDVVMIESWWWTRFALALRSDWHDVPIVVRSGGNDSEYALADARRLMTRRRYQSWVDEVVRSVDLVIANSEFSAKRLRVSDLGWVPTTVVRGGAPCVSRSPVTRGRPARVVVAGRLVDFKGVDDCIETIAAAQRHLDVELTVVGDGKLRASLARLAESRLRPRTFRFTGALSHDECVSTIASADVLLSMPRAVWRHVGSERYRHTETMGRSICEAVCAGNPVIATAVGGIPEILGSDIGTLVDERDTQAAAQGVMAWLERPKPAATTVDAYRRRLSWGAVFDQYDELLRDLSERRRVALPTDRRVE